MENWQKGDIKAFETLFHQYKNLVFNTALLMTGSREQAEDVSQAVFLSVWNARSTFNPDKGKLSTWLHQITVNKCTKNRLPRMPYLSLDECDVSLPQCQQPEEILIASDEYRNLLQYLADMDEKHRSVIVLRYFNDLSYTEIAGILNLPLGTVKSRLSQALLKLRQKQPGGDGEMWRVI